ncbi:hypothetical protein ZPAH1_orf00360 [Aeromonas phage ZPAH1]|nr:hypothetical protein ASwh1_314 [Aeromonas phage Aswh_1]QQG34122.1 hypothetical protein ZPAH1_orf00360 [Aeromonas phage ZPAH1]
MTTKLCIKFKNEKAQEQFIAMDVVLGGCSYSHNQLMANKVGMNPFDVQVCGEFWDIGEDFTIHIETENCFFEIVEKIVN